MDQLKDALSGVLKYGFWIGCTLILLISVGIWFIATSDLDEQNSRQTSKIEQSFTQVSSARGSVPTHPNETSHKEMREINEARQQDILNSWGELYKRQQDILVWPVDELKQDFVKEFEGKIPIETYLSYPTDEKDEIESSLRTRYQRYIDKVLPSIAEVGGTRWDASNLADSNEAAMMKRLEETSQFGTPDFQIVDEPLVAWDSGNQSALLSDLFPWRGGVPSTLEIYYSQENLWIFRQLMEVIATVNKGATQPYQAKIHQINQIAIGSSVEFNAGAIDTPDVQTDGFGDGAGSDFGAGGGFEDGGGFGGEEEAIDPAERRYLDVQGMPITGAELRSALTSAQPSDVALAIAKRVPVMMSLNMDQKSVPELVAACGSAKLLIQVRQLRLLPKSGSIQTTDSTFTPGTRGQASQQREEHPFDLNVQLFGVIFIYNPAKREQLGLEAITEETVDEVVAKATGDVDAARQAEVNKQTAPKSTNDVLPGPGGGTPSDAAPAETPAPDAAVPDAVPPVGLLPF